MDSMRLKVRITGEWFRLGGFHPHPQTRVQQHPPKFRTEAWGGGALPICKGKIRGMAIGTGHRICP